MILMLFVCVSILLYIIYIFNNNSIYSVAFFSTASFVISSFFYCVGYKIFQKDINFLTLFVIVASLICLFIGEKFGKKIKVGKSNSCNALYVYYIPKINIYIISMIMIIIFFYRFIDLYLFSLKIGNTRGIFGTIAVARLSYAMGKYESILPLYFIAIIGTLISEIIAYFFIYAFVNNLIIAKRVDKHYLLPIVAYALILISLTERTSYIKMVAVLMVALMVVVYKKEERKKRASKKLFKILLKVSVAFAVLFFTYGIVSRENETKLTTIELVEAYIGAPLYGLNYYLQNPWAKNTTWGQYTLAGIYNTFTFLGYKFEAPPLHLRMFEYGQLLTSNIYTFLMLPIQDFGIVFAILSRGLIGLLNGYITKKILTVNLQNASGLTMYIFGGMLFYMGIMAFCADRYKEILLNPSTLIKYTCFAWLVLRFILKFKTYPLEYKGVNDNENGEIFV